VICHSCRGASLEDGSPAWHHWCKARRLGDEKSTWCDCQHVGETPADGIVAPYRTMLLDNRLADVPEFKIEKSMR
jgi:hypothetical protein